MTLVPVVGYTLLGLVLVLWAGPLSRHYNSWTTRFRERRPDINPPPTPEWRLRNTMIMIVLFRVVGFVFVLLATLQLSALIGTKSLMPRGERDHTASPTHTPDGYVSDPGSVGFDIASVHRENGSVLIQGTYGSQGKLAKFGIEFGPTRRLDSTDSTSFPTGTGKGRFVGEPGSDAGVLLADLEKALEAKATPRTVQRVQALPFTFVNIGDKLSQASGGGFNTDPPGGWTATKIFIGEGEQEGELFLNFNPAIAKGQFSIKDPDYGDIVLRQLATVL